MFHIFFWPNILCTLYWLATCKLS